MNYGDTLLFVSKVGYYIVISNICVYFMCVIACLHAHMCSTCVSSDFRDQVLLHHMEYVQIKHYDGD